MDEPFEAAFQDVHRGQSHVLHFLGKTIGPLWNTPEPFEDRAGQCCFLCLGQEKLSSWAIQVPCLRPTVPRQIKSRRFSRVCVGGKVALLESSNGRTYGRLNHRRTACECDASIFHRLQEICLQSQTRWRRWLPFYEITDVREVIVRRVVYRYAIHD